MPLDPCTAAALRTAGLPLLEDVPMARRTWWRAGGPADGWVEVEDVAALQALQRVAHATGCPVFPLGNASNLLVSDKGVRGVVVHLSGTLASCRVLEGPPPPRLEVGGGMLLTALLRRARRERWTGLGCFAGIPGTLGGAVRMNAGAALGETVDVLEGVDVVLSDGTARSLTVAQLAMSYRTAHLPDGAVVALARLRTTGADPVEDAVRIDAHLERRAATQPLNQPSCGSTFRNPPGDHAGRLIEAMGLKGHRIGQAEVSEVHANFIVNLGGATASDIRALIEHVQETVAAGTGVRLQREVHYAGDWD